MNQIENFIFSTRCRGLHWVVFALMVVPSLVGCQDSSSRTGSNPAGSESGFVDDFSTQKSSGDVVDGGTQTTYYDHSESFVAEALEVKTLGKSVHMFWLVDTLGRYKESIVESIYSSRTPRYNASGKNMADEIAAINKHLPLLIKSLQKVSVVQAALMFGDASSVSGYTFETSESTSINRGVMESNSVHLIESWNMSESSGVFFLYNPMGYLKGKLTAADCARGLSHRSVTCHPSGDFFRDPKAFKIIVAVRDRGVSELAQYVKIPSSENVPTSLKILSGNNLSSFRYFAFIDLRDTYLNSASCKRNSVWGGCNYPHTRIVEQLGGEKYHTNNISSSEWTKVFDDLKSKIIEEISGSEDSGEKKQKATFTLQRPASKILEVKVEGQALPGTSFQVTGNTLYIDAEHVSEGQNIVVKYQSTQSS